jgi:succinyl-CoA:(S)-malate CoA-transferase subunit B
MERWNLGWDELRALNRGLIMVRISAFGQTGPARARPGFGRIAAAVSGVSYLSGYPDRPPVTPGTPTIPDYLAGTMGALGALVALQHRQRSGQGQMIDVGLYEPTLRMLDELIPAFAATGHVRERIGSGTEYVVPHNHYRARDGSWIAIACTNDRMFARLARDAMDRPELLAEFATVGERIKRREDVDGLVSTWVEQFDAREVLARLDAAEVPCSLVNSVRDLFTDPQVQARENIVSVPSPLGGLLHMAGIVPKLSATPGAIDHVGPLAVGEHNEEIYCGRLGLTREDLAALRARGIV